MVTRAAICSLLLACGSGGGAVSGADATPPPPPPDAGPPDAGPPDAGDTSAPLPPPAPAARSGSVDCTAGRWLSRTPAALPPTWPHARSSSGAAWDPDRRVLFMDGGSPMTWRQTTMEWQEASGTWTDRSRYDAFGPRASHALVHDARRHRFLAWGGSIRFGNAPWEWRPEIGQWKNLEPLLPPEAAPEQRGAPAAAYDAARDRFIVSGGYATTDLWEWDVTADLWERKTSRPPVDLVSLTGHALVYDSKRERVYMLGNRDAGPDVWRWDGASYTRIPSSNGSPLPRDWSMVAYDAARDRVMLFGGYVVTTPADPWRNDLWEWNPDTGAWTRCDGGAPIPSPRGNGAMVYDDADRTLVLFGGYGNDGNLADLWEWYIP